MMTVTELRTLFDYGYWANGKLLEVVARLTPEQFTGTVAGAYGSVRNTLVHMLSAEWGWLDRCGGAKRGPALDPADYPTAVALIERWRHVETQVREFLGELRDEDLGRVIEFVLGTGSRLAMPLGDLMRHAAIHGVHHRGQVSLLLRSMGVAPGNLDMLFYYRRANT